MTAWLLLLPGLPLLAWIGFKLHHLFEGEWLPHDLRREYRLSRKTLAELDAAWANAPNRTDITVTLTTTPSRIRLLDTTLKSLLDQTRPPARIILNVPEFSQREGTAYEIPDALTRLQSLDIHRCDDIGPGTKLIPTLPRVGPDAGIMVADDDRIYPEWLIACYEAAARAQPDIALTMGGWVVPVDLTDRFTTLRTSLMMQPPAPVRAPRLRRPREIDVMLGVFSYLVRPRFFDIARMADLGADPDPLRYVDDVRTSALCNVPKFVLPAPSLSFVPWARRKAFQASRLGLMNRGTGTEDERPNTLGIRHFADRWRVGGPK